MFQGSYNTLIFLLLVFILDADVLSEVISSGSRNISREACMIPASKDHYYVSFDESRPLHSGTDKVEGDGQTAVKVKCFSSLKHITDDVVICFDGQWYPADHGCEAKVCKPVHNTTTTNYTCTSPEGREISCAVPVPINSQITIHCAHWRFTNPNLENNTKLCLDGGWQEWKPCEPTCGRVKPFTDFIQIPKIERELYLNPWHVIIYRLVDKRWTQKCVGTILSSLTIITASVCFDPEGKSIDERTVKVAAGQFHDFKTAQSLSHIYDVHRISIETSDSSSIAMVYTETHIQFNDTVGDVCYYYDKTLNPAKEFGLQMAVLIENTNTGTIVKDTELMNYSQCPSSTTSKFNKNSILSIFDNFFKPIDQICAEFRSGRKFDPRDIGAGLVFQKPGKRAEFYLKGVLCGSSENGKVLNFLDTSNMDREQMIHKFVEMGLGLQHMFKMSKKLLSILP
ncbi:uncharacterized protein LOC111046670 [Nilaparvata lugens]|uniref:uncharacterized protein LOC111046670 n=1 Tax=Nilaparvata lugens TaxID=108931 RepID=UPI00193E877C|nr:uncharacterized protein LOC111046670 [Nilaparvata lugens]